MTASRLAALVTGCVLFLAAPLLAQPVSLPNASPNPELLATQKSPPAPELPPPGTLKARPGDDPVRVLKIERHNALLELLARSEAVLKIQGGREAMET
ncbi:MAG TPA: hypothetical protein VKE74_29085 [Gemmataceae bacterium]|nr:hypothetical protein [Gemmataceae bacterium]